jgi:hypothetical protein
MAVIFAGLTLLFYLFGVFVVGEILGDVALKRPVETLAASRAGVVFLRAATLPGAGPARSVGHIALSL